jgi:hypothetical protein
MDSMQEAILQNQSEMMSRIRELRVSDYASIEEYNAAVQEIYEQHRLKNEFYYSQLGIAIEDINTAYGRQVVAFEDLAISEVAGIQSIQEGISTFESVVGGLL